MRSPFQTARLKHGRFHEKKSFGKSRIPLSIRRWLGISRLFPSRTDGIAVVDYALGTRCTWISFQVVLATFLQKKTKKSRCHCCIYLLEGIACILYVWKKVSTRMFVYYKYVPTQTLPNIYTYIYIHTLTNIYTQAQIHIDIHTYIPELHTNIHIIYIYTYT